MLLSALLPASVSLLVRPETRDRCMPSELMRADRVEKHREVFEAPDLLRGKRLPGAGGEGWLPTALAPHDAARVPRREDARGERRAAGQVGVGPGRCCAVRESHKDTVLQGEGGIAAWRRESSPRTWVGSVLCVEVARSDLRAGSCKR